MNMWLKIKPYCLLVTLLGGGCAFMNDDTAKKPTTSLIATPASYYSTAKARYLGTRYKDNLDRLTERIVRNSTTSQLQFANNISSVGGIGFFTHSATKTPDERYLEVVVATPETFETKGEYSDKVSQLFARYGQELLAILAGDNEIFQDKELTGYGLNLAWRNVITEAPANRVTLARAIIYLPKERVQNYLRRNVSQSDLLNEAVIFAVEDNGPLNLVSYQPREIKPDFRPAIREDNLTAGSPPVKPASAPPAVADTAKSPGQKPTAKVEPVKRDVPPAQTMAPLASTSKPAAPAPVADMAPVAPLAQEPLVSRPAENASIAEAKPIVVKQDEKLANLPAARPPVEAPSITPVAETLLPPPVLTRSETPPKAEKSPDTSTVKERVVEAKVEPPKPSNEKAPAPRRAESVARKPVEAETSEARTKQAEGAANPVVVKSVAELASAPVPAKSEEIQRSEPIAPVVDLPAPVAVEKKGPSSVPTLKAESPKQAAERPAPAQAATAPKEISKAPAKPSEAQTADAPKAVVAPGPETALAAPMKSPAPLEKPAEPVKAPVEVKKIEPQKRIAVETTAAKTEPEPVIAVPPEPIRLAEVKSPAAPIREPAMKTAEVTPARKAEPAPRPIAVKTEVQNLAPVPAPVIVPDQQKTASAPEQLALVRKPVEPVVESTALVRPAPKPLQGFIIQLAFNDKQKAQNWAEKMTQRGYAVSVTEAGAEGSLRVRLGNFTIRDEAERQLQSFKQEGMNGIIINLPQAFRPEARSSMP